MSAIGVGKEILSQCNKCKLILAHIIVTMKDATDPDKVMCKTCKGTHSYKDPSAKKKKATIDKVIKNHKVASGKKITQSVAEIWTQALSTSQAPAVAYSIRTNYKKGDVISHPNFGDGIVERLIDSNKIEVLFKDEYKTLLHNK